MCWVYSEWHSIVNVTLTAGAINDQKWYFNGPDTDHITDQKYAFSIDIYRLHAAVTFILNLTFLFFLNQPLDLGYINIWYHEYYGPSADPNGTK